MELPYQTFERVTGKKWTGGNSADVQSAYQQYGITAPAGSAEANLALQKALQGGIKSNPMIAGQTSIMQSTNSQNNLDKKGIKEIENTVANTYGTVNPNNPQVPGAGVVPGTTQPPASGPAIPANNQSTPSTIKSADGKSLQENIPSGFSYNLPILGDGSKYLYGQDGSVYKQTPDGQINLDPIGEQQRAKNEETNKEIANFNLAIDKYKQGLDASHIALLDSIKETARLQTQKMEDLNKATLGLKTVAGYRTGGAEYTPEINAGILKKEQADGLARLDEIQVNLQSAIAQAVSAKNAKDFELATKTLENVKSLQKAKEDAVQTMFKNYNDGMKAINDQIKQANDMERANRDQAMQEFATAAPSVYKEYDKLNAQGKQAFIQNMSKKTGLDPEILLGEMEKARKAYTVKEQSTKIPETELQRIAISSLAGNMDKVKGPDGYIAPEDWIFYKQNWVKKGMKAKDFDDNFKMYLNPESYFIAGL